ncbi:hypothetical protein DM860_008455 [Cuscuta australis]|uniref:DNA polymerase n=1 Tax=Cuscuta australis TaxID=267555 RepID=A0A328D4P3_9ASTE|nr:hypothetical protein DM860_008455 [Cuscuta australis]
MSDEPSSVAGRRRSRGRIVPERTNALERLKAIKSGERCSRDAAQIKMEDPIYDLVDEDEYGALVAKRCEESRGFIVDDNGMGYGDEGQEEDWSVAGLPQSSDDSEGEAGRPKKKNTSEKKPQPAAKKQPAARLSTAASLADRQQFLNMLNSTVHKRSSGASLKNLSCDSIVDDVIAEFAPDETDRERRRRGSSNLSLKSVTSAQVNTKYVSAKSERPIKESVNLIVNEETRNDDPCESTMHVPPDSQLSDKKDLPEKIERVSSLDAEMKEKGAVELSDNANLDAEMKEKGVVVLSDNAKKGIDNDGNLLSGSNLKEAPMKEDKVFSLNAKIKTENNLALSATAEWQTMRSSGKSSASNLTNAEENSDLELESDGSFPFFIIDAYEELYGANSGNIYLFGKVKVKGTYHSCCVVLTNMQRCVYAIPNRTLFQKDAILKLEMDLKESQISAAAFHSRLHEMASDLKTELTKKLVEHNVSRFSMNPVKRNYAFERPDIPLGENYVLKISYPFKDPPLPPDLKGEHFCALLGTHSSALELFLVKRKIKGPSWLSISKSASCPTKISWCKFEITVDNPKDIHVLKKNIPAIPPLVVTAINVKTIINEKQNVNEIVSASVVTCHKVKIDAPTLTSELTKMGMLSHFTVVRKLDGGIYPLGFAKEAADRNAKAGSKVISLEVSERALLNCLMTELHKLDSDVLVGHNISGFDLDVLLHRVQAPNVQNKMWSKIGRLKRSVMPKLTKGNNIFGSGASLGIMSCIAGRLLCDTYLCSRDLLQQVSYSLTQLTKTVLHKDRKEMSPHDIPQMFQASDSLMKLIEYGETDAWLSMELMFHLSVLPLTLQLTNISGNLWCKTLQGARAQRVEYLLLHEFHSKKFIVPDKISSKTMESKLTKRKQNGRGGKETDEINLEDPSFGNDLSEIESGKTKKGPAYSGGLVLEPKRGLYDKYILLLDFNSLYPSIIQEYNICFTTVERSQDDLFPSLPSSKDTGVLPKLLEFLVNRRKEAKKSLKSASGLQARRFDIQQQALKLTANSMYGCLGFQNSRFYAKPLAELITQQGRELLQSTVDLVQNTLNLEVIYGDTDSIMIYSGVDDISKATSIARKVIDQVNKKYKCLEIDLDGLYKRMLLLKKKKYAAVKVQFKDGKFYEDIEKKGLDMVRRDWSLISKELGDFCLSQILSGGSCEDVVQSIHNALIKVQEDMRNGQVDLEKYIITKSLTKSPEAYPDSKSQPHVEVALRLKKSGYITGCSAGDTVPYIICCEQGNSTGSSVGIAQRARHPDELKNGNGKWTIDIDYYLAQQIHPVVARLCAPVQGTSPAHLAVCLGLDASKFQSKLSNTIDDDPSSSLLCAVDDVERYRGCEPLIMVCPDCSTSLECPPIFNSVCSSISQKPTDLQAERPSIEFWHKLQCPKCPKEPGAGKLQPSCLANQVKRQAEGFISTYYRGLMLCDDETCNYSGRSLNLRVIGDSERGTVCPNYPRCEGHLQRKYTEGDLYKQLSYFCHILDTERCINKVDAKMKVQVEKEMAEIRPLVKTASSTIEKLRNRCGYGWVQLRNLTVDV